MSAPMHGVAIDAGSDLARALRVARGAQAEDDDLFRFKQAVVAALAPQATTVLVDATLGPRLLADFPPGCAPMIAYEADVYRIDSAERITVLPDSLRIDDLPGMGVGHVKFFMWYAPDDDPALNARKQALVARVGAECRAQGMRFLMEPLVYHPELDPGTAAFAAAKPDLVCRAVEVFAQPRFGADMLKVEVPADLSHATEDAALRAFARLGEVAGQVPIVFLSAGVPFVEFERALRLAHRSGVPFAGFMCGRALWSDAVPVHGAGGVAAARDWLMTEGRRRLARLKTAMEGGDG